ncbi:hypothetical protein [Paraburkholderia sp.]|uniref:hypothetical protein n=1 Tax=Paraburkholderia sp. TaxID=1926495 RepID=UPI0023917A90|nr:hypothetical protein [Paraburkholderia sp.]MDE1184231.1 hypothetical protein [Paraburkholderia sp.]
MLTTPPRTATRGTDATAITVTWYADTGCLRFSNATGRRLHELLPPHSWFALLSAAGGEQSRNAAPEVDLHAVLRDFCDRNAWRSTPTTRDIRSRTDAHFHVPAIAAVAAPVASAQPDAALIAA